MLNHDTDEARFYTTYERLAAKGTCDSAGGMEYRRVFTEWVEAGCPDNVEHFIYCRANVGPDGRGPEQWQ